MIKNNLKIKGGGVGQYIFKTFLQSTLTICGICLGEKKNPVENFNCIYFFNLLIHANSLHAATVVIPKQNVLTYA